MFTHPGKKLLFMGGEFAQWPEWAHDHSIEWHVLADPMHRGVQKWVQDLNHLYRSEPALYEVDFAGSGFEWIDFHDADNSVITYLLRDKTGAHCVAVACNLTPVPRHNYRIGVPKGGFWKEILNSDAKEYGGSGQGNMGGVEASLASFYGRFDYSLSATLPPLGVVVFKQERDRSVPPTLRFFGLTSRKHAISNRNRGRKSFSDGDFGQPLSSRRPPGKYIETA
jgi:1,4-alpha-glucan branching enzyme